MTRREELLEQYEDALFTLLMDDFAASEGAKALEENERLKTEAEIVPLPVQQRCVKFINRYYNKQNLRVMGRTAYKFLNKVAMVTLVAVVSFSTAFAASPTFRANTLNMVIAVFDDHTEISFNQENEGIKDFNNLLLTTNWLPDDWHLIEEHNDSVMKWNVYETAFGRAEISVMKATNAGANYDTENAHVETVEIHGSQALLIEKENILQIIWTDEDTGILWDAFVENGVADDLLKVAENSILK